MLSATPPAAEPAYDPFNTGGDADADEGGLPSILVIIHFSYIVHLDVQSSLPIPPISHLGSDEKAAVFGNRR